MHMVVFPIHFHQGRFHVITHLAEHPAHPVYGVAIEHSAAVFPQRDGIAGDHRCAGAAGVRAA